MTTMADPVFRLARLDDVPALAALYADAARTLGPTAYSAEQVAAWQSFGADTPEFRDYVLGARTWVADAGGDAAGFCGIDDAGEVRSLYVRPALGRSGLGTRLLAHALADARSRGVAHFAAWASPFSQPLFERAGFRVARSERTTYQGVDFERRRMERP
jgi:putative acetyltransferase